jgi:hypothetical protein
MEDRFVDNGDGTVTDTCTGLMWQKDTADTNGDQEISLADKVPWEEALQYCETLELAGHNDWRLPNLRALQSIVDHGRSRPAIDPVFSVVIGQYYWSSSSYVPLPVFAWSVDYTACYTSNTFIKDGNMCVRAVRTILPDE